MGDQIPIRSKFLLTMSLAAWLTIPLSTSNIILTKLFPLSMGPIFDFLVSFIGAIGLYGYIFGYTKQFHVLRFSYLRILMSVFEIVLASTLSIICENLAVISMWGGDWSLLHCGERQFGLRRI